MSKEELIRLIEKYETPHSERLLKQFPAYRLQEYLEYLEMVGTPRRELESVAG